MPNTHLEAEIAKAKKQAADRIAKLKRAAAAEQRAIDAGVIALLRERYATIYQQLADESVDALVAARAKRSNRARRKPTIQPTLIPESNDEISNTLAVSV